VGNFREAPDCRGGAKGGRGRKEGEKWRGGDRERYLVNESLEEDSFSFSRGAGWVGVDDWFMNKQRVLLIY
jgi:hypothetical protein